MRTAVVLIALIAGFAALKIGENIFAPMTLAVVVGVILSPLAQAMERMGLPRGLVSAGVLVVFVLLFAVIAFLIEPLIWRLTDAMPRIRFELRYFVEELRGLIRGLDEVNKEVEQALGTSNGAAKAAGGEEGDVAKSVPNLTDALFFAPVILAQALIFLGTLFFFLLTRAGIYDWISHWSGRTREQADRIRDRFRTAEILVSRYFFTITLINLALGAALAGALALIGLPAPIVWGAVAAGLNYILYLGPMTVTAGLLVAGVVAFNGLFAVVPPLIFLCLNMIEGQFVTPTLVGRNISVNPLLVFVSLVVWLWLWGPIGGIVAIPVLVTVLALLDIFDGDEVIGKHG
ncbi:AI-2E family transporter [Roseovarius spongiae]|uniref:AI-2E family transporter n=1 Tax=Roseovarius spongiae TaxID=2320272 RepID=UPI001FE646B3|nr:AI-2E family transporter [Roseovarius spongiae]